MVVFLFLRNARATLIPGMVVPISLVGTFGVMYLFGYSIDNLSLMALTISTGFVVDDAIVVIENISRYLEEGYTPYRAAVQGTRRNRIHRHVDQHLADRGVHSDSADGRNRRPAVPRICGDSLCRDRGLDGRFADHHADDVREAAAFPARSTARTLLPQQRTCLQRDARLLRAKPEVGFASSGADRSPSRWRTLVLNIYLFKIIPKGFFPEQDTGRLMGAVLADQDTSFQAMHERLVQIRQSDR